jgi:methylglutamate dehydrogenase subunit C
MAFRRLDKGGRIDRARTVSFTYDGHRLFGQEGDTLASALLASGRTLVGRSFKYHRPRGFLSAGVEEPNGLFTIGEGTRQEPNIPGTMLPLSEGLVVKSQNAWPSPHFDLMAVNSLAAPLLGAGFYYKTFMGPFKKSWMFYEPMIRRAAGLGRVDAAADSHRYDTQFGFCDVLVAGSGPAGLSAAFAAGQNRTSCLAEPCCLMPVNPLPAGARMCWTSCNPSPMSRCWHAPPCRACMTATRR